jgi:hypothetical protein
MKAKVFEVILQKLGSEESPGMHLEAQFNDFLRNNPRVILTGTHINTVTLPPERNAMRGTQASEPSTVIFATVFYNDN